MAALSGTGARAIVRIALAARRRPCCTRPRDRSSRPSAFPRRLPAAGRAQVLAMRTPGVCACLPEPIQKIRRRRGTAGGVSRAARAGGCADSARAKSSGSTGSGSTATGAISRATVVPTTAAARTASCPRTRWPPRPSGGSVACNGCPANRPSTLTRPAARGQGGARRRGQRQEPPGRVRRRSRTQQARRCADRVAATGHARSLAPAAGGAMLRLRGDGGGAARCGRAGHRTPRAA